MSTPRIRTDAFDGPFDLLLRLVVSNKIDVCALSLDDIVVQYLSAMNTARSIPDEIMLVVTFLVMKLLMTHVSITRGKTRRIINLRGKHLITV